MAIEVTQRRRGLPDRVITLGPVKEDLDDALIVRNSAPAPVSAPKREVYTPDRSKIK